MELFVEREKATSTNVIQQKTNRVYEAAYKSFMEWQEKRSTHSFTENVLLVYFNELALKYKANSLWTIFSMLKSTINLHHNIEIEKYAKLKSFLKKKSEGYNAKKAKIFSSAEINTFIRDAVDKKHLLTKVALIVGVVGACRCSEMKQLNISDVEDLGSVFTVTIHNTTTKSTRKFSITGTFYDIIKKYIDLRTDNITILPFFVNYQNGKCINTPVGINKFSSMGKTIAKYLCIPNPETYTGHSFRRSSAIISIDPGAHTASLISHSDLEDSIVVKEEERIEYSTDNVVDTIIDDKMTTIIQNASSSSTKTEHMVVETSTPTINITNCHNCVIHVYYKGSVNR